jgi:hypothetical protein
MNAHSPLGASGAERWMNCPGSNVLLNTLNLPQTEESDFAKEGTAAHSAAAHCVLKNLAAWEIVGQEFDGYKVTTEMADAIQDYLDYVNPLKAGAAFYCEYHISADFHPLFYGTVDFASFKDGLLHIVDFKYGQGVVVEPENNPQLQYYAYGLLLNHVAERVRITIVQPRAFHAGGGIRSWDTTGEALNDWGYDTLVPAMQAAEVDETLTAGEWCRFCPAKLACPLLHGLFKAAAMANPKDITNLSDTALGRDYALRDAVKMYLKAQDDEMYRRLSGGKVIAEAKLVHKKADRVFKDGAADKLQIVFGDEVFTAPELKSPAQIEKLGPAAKKLVAELAFTPDTGLTVAPAGDRRQAVKMQTTAEAFGGAIAKLEEVS